MPLRSRTAHPQGSGKTITQSPSLLSLGSVHSAPAAAPLVSPFGALSATAPVQFNPPVLQLADVRSQPLCPPRCSDPSDCFSRLSSVRKPASKLLSRLVQLPPGVPTPAPTRAAAEHDWELPSSMHVDSLWKDILALVQRGYPLLVPRKKTKLLNPSGPKTDGCCHGPTDKSPLT